MGKEGYEFNIIGQNVRFGFGYRTVEGNRQYFAFYGFPNRNDDYFYNAEISLEEYHEIKRRYVPDFDFDPRGEAFYEKYVKDHPILLEGWSRLL
ncbi:MAG: hypothetical protein IKZ91_01120 [Bacteroidales bacterium]|nr:hypothetical protein [Bacteroidales bacterium]